MVASSHLPYEPLGSNHIKPLTCGDALFLRKLLGNFYAPQEAINFCIERLNDGDWLHIFPEGRVNMHNEFIRFKWGIGRIIYELPVTPIVVPIWQIGMENILPNAPPYIFRTGKLLTINFGNPIDLSKFLLEMKSENHKPETARRLITEFIQDELLLLKLQTEKLHFKA